MYQIQSFILSRNIKLKSTTRRMVGRIRKCYFKGSPGLQSFLYNIVPIELAAAAGCGTYILYFVFTTVCAFCSYSALWSHRMSKMRTSLFCLRNISALAVNCWVIVHCLEVSCKGDQISSAECEWFICLQLTDKQWIITQLLIYFDSNIQETMKKQLYPSDYSKFPPLHWRNPAKGLTVTPAFTCLSYVYNAQKRRYTV